MPEPLAAFDFPDPSTVTGRRDTSIVAPQALFVMNNGFVLEQSRHAARRLLAEAGFGDRERIERAYWLALGRPPEAGEVDAISAFLRDAGGGEQQKWAQVFQSLFGSIDFRYVD